MKTHVLTTFPAIQITATPEGNRPTLHKGGAGDGLLIEDPGQILNGNLSPPMWS